MIKGKEKKELTSETVLNIASEYSIYRYYIGKDFKIGHKISSPFRDDPSPSFIISNQYGFLSFKDFGDSGLKGNCFQFVMMLFNINYNEALEKINYDLGLGIGEGTPKVYKQIVREYKQPEISIPKRDTRIKASIRPYTPSDLAYWSQYHITKEDLIREKIYSIKKLRLNDTNLGISPTELIFGYLYDDKWKIYRPNGDDLNKWLSNVPGILEGLENIPKGTKKCLITKSKKDKLVCLKVFPYVGAAQNESTGGFTEENVKYLKGNCEEIYIFFDGDEPGIKNSRIVAEQFGFNEITIPPIFVQEGIKDASDLVKKYGLEALREFFIERGLIIN